MARTGSAARMAGKGPRTLTGGWWLSILLGLSTAGALRFTPPNGMRLTRRGALNTAISTAAAGGLLPPRRCSAEPALPQAAVLLRVAEVTSVMEQQMTKAAAMTGQQRLDEGFDFARGDMKMSIDILLKNTKLALIPQSDECVGTLRGIQRMCARVPCHHARVPCHPAALP